METTTHTISAFDEDMRDLRMRVAEMCGIAEKQLERAINVLLERDIDRARKVVQDDKQLDSLEEIVETLGVRIIALRSPRAEDLREVIAALKISAVLERIGDYAKNIAKRTPEISRLTITEPLSVVMAMVVDANRMTHDALDAYMNRDADLAVDICQRDYKIDNYFHSLFRMLLTYMVENPNQISACAHLLYVIKHVERIGDHATNIAEMVYFAVTGNHMGDRPKGHYLEMDGIDV